MAVGIQGEVGSNSARAVEVLKCAGPVESYRTFAETFAALQRGTVSELVVPFENSIAGVVVDVAERLLVRGTSIRAEVLLPIEFVIAAVPHATPKRLLAHPVAAAQCSHLISSLPYDVVTCHDTAGAARLVREANDPELAALCPPSAASLYSLVTLYAHCTNDAASHTRFFLVSGTPVAPDATDTRALLWTRPHGPLADALAQFAHCGLDVRAIHSLPRNGRALASAWLVEVAHAGLSSEVRAWLELVGESGRLIGSYPVAEST